MPANGMYALNNVSNPSAPADSGPASNGPDAGHGGEPSFSQLGISHTAHLGANPPVHPQIALDLSQLASPSSSSAMTNQQTPVNLEPFFSPSNTSAIPSPFTLSQQQQQQQHLPHSQTFPNPHLVLPVGFHVDPVASSPLPQLFNQQQQPIRLPYQQNVPAGFPQAGPSYPVPFSTPQDYHFGAGVSSLIGQRAFSDEWPIEWDDDGDQLDNRADLYPGMEMSMVGFPTIPPPLSSPATVIVTPVTSPEGTVPAPSPLKQRTNIDKPKVKHRRRTTPEQLRILEAEFDRNNKPDNSKREELAAMLGMTKRNVQVWFQNRCAKADIGDPCGSADGQAGKDEESQPEEGTGPRRCTKGGYEIWRNG